MIINTSDMNQARKQIQELKKENKQIIVQAQDNKFNRKILENKDIDLFLSPELHDRKERLKQRDSGLNEFMCKLAKKNNIKIGINIKEIKKLDKKQKSKILARIIQNIKLCKRTKTQIILFPDKHKKQDIMSFFLSLKSSTQQAKGAVNK
jgi:RNase P/RNase MRP subunit p30